jgi:hypothetical protein
MSRLGSVGMPVLGFAAGWGSWTLLDKFDMISPSRKQHMYMWQLKGMRSMSSVLPEGVVVQMSLPSTDTLDAMIGHLEVALGGGEEPREPERVPFDEVLMQCRVQEQIEWLEEHVEEDIPFFFIADLFNAFANVHEYAFSSVPGALEAEGGAYDSPVLVRGTFTKMLNGVIPFDVSIRVLAALIAKSKVNAATLVELRGQASVLERPDQVGDLPEESAAESIVRLHADYIARMAEKGTPEGDSCVPSETVNIASLQVLQTLNDVQVRHRKWYKPIVRPTGPFPLFAGMSGDQRGDLCRTLGVQSDRLLPSTSRFAEASKEALKCYSN